MDMLPTGLLSGEAQELLAIPDPDLDKFNPDNAVRRSSRAAKTPAFLAAESVNSAPKNSRAEKVAENAPKSTTVKPRLRKKQKQVSKVGGISPASEQDSQDNEDIEMDIEDNSIYSDAQDEYVPGSKKRLRSKQGHRECAKTMVSSTTAEANVDGMTLNQAPVITHDAGIDASVFLGLQNSSGALPPEPAQSGASEVADSVPSSTIANSNNGIGIMGTATNGNELGMETDGALDARFAVEIQSFTTGIERPDSQEKPLVWADGRQALCETLPYFRGYQSAGYSFGGLIYGFLLDKECHSRDYMDATAVITRAGGGLTKNTASGMMVQNRNQSETEQVKAMRNNIERRVPIILLVGSGNPKCPSKVPHTYCVMGWFKPTHIWSEMEDGKQLFKYRLEKLNLQESSWWAPKAHVNLMSTSDSSMRDVSADNTDAQATCLSATGPSNFQPSVPAAYYGHCASCHDISPQIYFQGWMCLNRYCNVFWKLHGVTKPGHLSYDLRFLRQETTWPTMKEPYGLKPAPLAINGPQIFSFDVSYAAWKGLACPKCGRCNSRQNWAGWSCLNEKCGFVYNMPHNVIPAQALFDPNHPLTDGHAIPRDVASTPIVTQVEFFREYRVHTYTIPDCGTVVHFMANKVINEQRGGPDEMWHDVQSGDIGLKRFELQNNGILKGPMLTQHFAINYGMPYKYAVAVDSESFDNSCQAIRLARTRLNWAGRYVAETSGQHQEFNELLALGYFERQAIDYHDDGEVGLGPTIATLSLGYPANMKIRMKSKHYSGLSKGGVYLHADPPVPGCMHYDARLQAYTDMDGMSPVERKAYGQMLKQTLGLRNQNCPVVLSMHLNHGDIVVMHGSKIQKYYEHAVQPVGQLRFALTCRYIDPNSLTKEDAPNYEVEPDDGFYDGEHPAMLSVPTPPSSAGNGEGLPEASDLPALDASIN